MGLHLLSSDSTRMVSRLQSCSCVFFCSSTVQHGSWIAQRPDQVPRPSGLDVVQAVCRGRSLETGPGRSGGWIGRRRRRRCTAVSGTGR